MSNKKITVKRRNNIAKSNKNAVGNLLKALKKPMQMPKRRPPSMKNNRLVNNGFAQNENVFAPASFGSKTRIQKPSFGRANTIVKHSEYIADLNGSVAFTTQLSLSCNPGIAASFPWLAQIADAYEKYKIKFLQYRFETEAPTSYTGAIFLSPEYNPQDAAPLSKAETFQNENTVRTVPWVGIASRIPDKYLKVYNEYFVRQGALAANVDVKTYDPLVMYVCTQGQAGATLVGEIWVDYEIELINPQGNLAPAAGYSGEVVAANPNTAIFNGMSTSALAGGPLPVAFTTNSNVVTLSSLIIGLEYQATVVLVTAVPVSLTVVVAGATRANHFDSLIDAATSTYLSQIETFTATGTSCTLTYSAAFTSMSVAQISILPKPGYGW
jgi:hypothetical protein